MGRRAALAAALAVAAVLVALPVGARPASAETIREMQWWLAAVNATQAQRVTGGDGVTVAVLDSGVDAGHPDLSGAVLPGASFLGSRSSNGQTDPQGHGTRMAGVIAARGANANRALGIAPRSRILPVAIPVEGTVPSIAEAVRWAVDRGAKVLNVSLGRQPDQRLPAGEAEAIAYAVAKDVVVVISAGNSPTQPKGNALAMLPGVVAVSGTGKSGAFAPSISVQGAHVGLAAPAQDIVGAAARNVHTTGYSAGDGTSESAAIVSGVAALIRAKFPTLDAANVINRLVRTATDRGAAGRDPMYGFGVVDANKALTADVPPVTTNPLAGTPTAAGPASATPAARDTTAQAGPDGRASRSGVLLVALIGGGLCVLVVLALVIMLIVRPRRPRHVPAPAYPGYPPAPPGWPPPGPGPGHGGPPPQQRPYGQ